MGNIAYRRDGHALWPATGGWERVEVLVVNTHPGHNPAFVGRLAQFLSSLGIAPQIMSGYEGENPLQRKPSRIILSGVPIDADYSLAQSGTQRIVDKAFGWLPDAECPVLGICYGHQILAHVFGGTVSTLPQMVKDERFPLSWPAQEGSGILAGAARLRVFAEHRDYVSQRPQGFTVLCQVGPVPYVMVNQEREMVGLQFVPEQSDESSKELLKRFVAVV